MGVLCGSVRSCTLMYIKCARIKSQTQMKSDNLLLRLTHGQVRQDLPECRHVEDEKPTKVIKKDRSQISRRKVNV